jgi:hemoglobin
MAAPTPPTTDIESEVDIHTIVRAFYADMILDPVLGHYFTGLDWDHHIPRLVTFWSSLIFHTGAYQGEPFTPHTRMPGLSREHFAHWLERFGATIDAHHAGPRADELKARAEQIAGVFQVKLGLWETPS